MTELGLSLTVPVDVSRRVLDQAIARITPHESQPEPEVQKLYVWESDGIVLAIGITAERPNVGLGDLVLRQRHPNDWSSRYALVVGLKPNEEACVLTVEEGKAGTRAVPLTEVVHAPTAWLRNNQDLLDPDLTVTHPNAR